MSNNGFPQIFDNCSSVGEIFSCHNCVHLVCRGKMCSKTFENWLTNKKKFWSKTFLKRDFLYKNLMYGR